MLTDLLECIEFTFRDDPDYAAEIAVWLKKNLMKCNQEEIEDWLRARNRCPECGSSHIETKMQHHLHTELDYNQYELLPAQYCWDCGWRND